MVIRRFKYLLPVVLLVTFGGYGEVAEVPLKVIDPIESVISPEDEQPTTSINDLEENGALSQPPLIQPRAYTPLSIAVLYEQQHKVFLAVKVHISNCPVAHRNIYPFEKEAVS